MVMLSLYVPAARPAILTDTFKLEGVVPEVGLTLSQGAFLLILKLGWLPVLLRPSVCTGGLAPPCAAVKVKLVGFATRFGPVTIKLAEVVVPHEFVTLIGPEAVQSGTTAMI